MRPFDGAGACQNGGDIKTAQLYALERGHAGPDERGRRTRGGGRSGGEGQGSGTRKGCAARQCRDFRHGQFLVVVILLRSMN